jgi:hypothetical protein
MYNSSIMKIVKTLSILFFILTITILPLRAHALVPPLMPFGGWPDITPIPCTCSIGLWSWFGPLYITGSIPLTGPLVYLPYSTLPLANYLITAPATPHLGSYIPGVQACWMYAVAGCFPLPSLGLMGFVGTGLPGGK